jgi:hypothetical protein
MKLSEKHMGKRVLLTSAIGIREARVLEMSPSGNLFKLETDNNPTEWVKGCQQTVIEVLGNTGKPNCRELEKELDQRLSSSGQKQDDIEKIKSVMTFGDRGPGTESRSKLHGPYISSESTVKAGLDPVPRTRAFKDRNLTKLEITGLPDGTPFSNSITLTIPPSVAEECKTLGSLELLSPGTIVTRYLNTVKHSKQTHDILRYIQKNREKIDGLWAREMLRKFKPTLKILERYKHLVDAWFNQQTDRTLKPDPQCPHPPLTL